MDVFYFAPCVATFKVFPPNPPAETEALTSAAIFSSEATTASTCAAVISAVPLLR